MDKQFKLVSGDGKPSVTWYVNTKFGNDSNDGLSPETAFCTREQAYNMCAVKGDVIYIVRRL